MENFDESETVSPPTKGRASEPGDKKRKSNASNDGNSSKKKKEEDVVVKRKREEELVEPKKYKNAFNIFVKGVRADAERELTEKFGEAPSVSFNLYSSILFTEQSTESSKCLQKDDLKSRILSMWEETSEETKAEYEAEEREDKARYF
jgi:hypothetical protein